MKVFINYSRKDQALADKVVAALEDAGLDAWYDKREIMPGENWARKISKGLKESDAMVVLLTPDALESDFVRANIDFALSESAYDRRLIPVLVGEPGDILARNIPWIFKHLKTMKLSEHGRNEEQLKQIAQVLKEVA
ncbi:MAG: toll/interleukin-1 receptor domain-containing protein [Acidobacteriota bacterium]